MPIGGPAENVHGVEPMGPDVRLQDDFFGHGHCFWYTILILTCYRFLLDSTKPRHGSRHFLSLLVSGLDPPLC